MKVNRDRHLQARMEHEKICQTNHQYTIASYLHCTM